MFHYVNGILSTDGLRAEFITSHNNYSDMIILFSDFPNFSFQPTKIYLHIISHPQANDIYKCVQECNGVGYI